MYGTYYLHSVSEPHWFNTDTRIRIKLFPPVCDPDPRGHIRWDQNLVTDRLFSPKKGKI
jgi:hypothetical protein